MGWWRRRSNQDFMRSVDGERDYQTGELRLHRYGMTITDMTLRDLPGTIQGKGSLLKAHPMCFLEREMPGISHAMYEWFEPESPGELVGELLSSWRGEPLDADEESEEDD